jgi:DNA-binding MarR family transcriptional regulator
VARAESEDHAIRDVQRVASFRVALREFQRGTERVARSSGLTPQWYLLLLLVKGSEYGDEHATVSELADRMQLAQSTVTELVNRAQGAGIVRRQVSPTDGRVAYIELTEEGERRFAASFRGLAEERRALRRAVSELDE